MPKRHTKKLRQILKHQQAVVALAFVLIFGGLGVHYFFTSHAATGEPASVNWNGDNSKLKSIASGFCVTTPGTTKGANGTKLVLATCDSRTGEKWTVHWGNGTVKDTTVVNGYSQCLTDPSASTTPNTPVQVSACNGQAASQTWQTGFGEGSIRIHGMCLGTIGNSTSSGVTLALINCTTTPPTPSVSLTAPKSGAKVSGTSVTVSASASTSAGSISRLTVTANGANLKACTNTTACSATWNVSKLKNGSYTVSASATASGGGSKTTSEAVTVSNPVPKPPTPPAKKPTPKPTPTPAPVNSSPPKLTTSSTPKKPSLGITATPQPANGSGTALNTTQPTTTTTGPTVSNIIATKITANSISLAWQGTSSNTYTIKYGTSQNNLTNSVTLQSTDAVPILTLSRLPTGKTIYIQITPSNGTTIGSATTASFKTVSPHSALGAIILWTLLIFAATIIFIFVLLKRRLSSGSKTDVDIENLPVYPQEDSATQAARLNWWLPEEQRQQAAHPQPQQPKRPDEEFPDMFAEGRKRLEDEEKERHNPEK